MARMNNAPEKEPGADNDKENALTGSGSISGAKPQAAECLVRSGPHKLNPHTGSCSACGMRVGVPNASQEQSAASPDGNGPAGKANGKRTGKRQKARKANE